MLRLLLQMPFRFDKGQLRKPRRLDDGRLIVDGVITRTGVFTYVNRDGSIRREYRPPEEVFRQDSMESFQLNPITNDHPAGGEVTSANLKELAIGFMGENIRQDGNLLIGSLMFADAEGVNAVESGKTSLSCGYELDIDPTPGVTPTGEAYDCVQRNIRGNHVALVDAARAGVMARIRMDAADVAESVETTQESTTMDPQLIKALEEKASLKIRLDAAEAQITALKAEVETATTRADSAEGERDSQKVRADKAEALRTDGAELSKLVQERAALERDALAMIGDDEYSPEGRTDVELRADALEAREDFKFDAKTHKPSYVQTRFDSALHYFKKDGDPYAGLVKREPGESREDSSKPSAYERMKARNQAASQPQENA